MGRKGIHAILLAAGSSQRIPDQDKLLFNWHGEPLICHVVHELVHAQISNLTVVLRPNTDIPALLPKYPIMILIENPAASTGMGSSLQLGLNQINPESAGLMICLADMPLIDTLVYSHIVKKFLTLEPLHQRILIPTYEGRRGNPVIFSMDLLPKLKALPQYQDAGAKDLINRSGKWVTEFPVETNAVLVDIDYLVDFRKHHTNNR